MHGRAGGIDCIKMFMADMVDFVPPFSLVTRLLFFSLSLLVISKFLIPMVMASWYGLGLVFQTI